MADNRLALLGYHALLAAPPRPAKRSSIGEVEGIDERLTLRLLAPPHDLTAHATHPPSQQDRLSNVLLHTCRAALGQRADTAKAPGRLTLFHEPSGPFAPVATGLAAGEPAWLQTVATELRCSEADLITGGATALLAYLLEKAATARPPAGGGELLAGAALFDAALFADGSRAGRLPDPQEPPLAEGAAALYLASPEDPAFGPRLHLCGATDTPHLDSPGWCRLIDRALAAAACQPVAIERSLTTSRGAAARLHQVEALLGTLGGSAPELLQIRYLTGDCGAVPGLLALLSVVEEMKTALLLADDGDRSLALVASPV